MNKIKIYRLCRDQKTISSIKKQTAEYSFPESILITGPDCFEFYNNILEEAEADYVLTTHDDVILPVDIEDRINECIKKCDTEFGSSNWGLAGNAGVEFLSEKLVRYIADPHSKVIPNKSRIPHVATHLDGNTILFNLKTLREHQVRMPSDLSGFHFYDFVVVAEAYLKGLISAIDSTLFVLHKSKGNQKEFDVAKQSEKIQNYWVERFINNKVKTINGDVKFNNNLDYLDLEVQDTRKDYYALIKEVWVKAKGKNKIELYLGVRTTLERPQRLERLLESIRMLNNLNSNIEVKPVLALNNTDATNMTKLNKLTNSFKDLDIHSIYVSPADKLYPRVASIIEIINHVPAKEDAFVWFIDDDDFVLPPVGEYLNLILNNAYISIGNSLIFEEKWEDSDQSIPVSSVYQKKLAGDHLLNIYIGDNFIPLCSAIYPTYVLKEVVDKHPLYGDYYEDYALLVLALKYTDARTFNVNMAGISYHGNNVSTLKDRTHWDYSLATFMSEVVNSGLYSENLREFMENNTIISTDPLVEEFRGFTQGQIWKSLLIYRSIKYRIKKFARYGHSESKSTN